MAQVDPDIDRDRMREDADVDALLRGAIDLHTHPGPSPLPRRVGIDDLAREAAEFGFAAIVAKSHHHSMQTDVLALRSAGALPSELDVFSGIACNRTIGGLNPYAVELALKMGARVVWLPTIASSAHYAHQHDSGQVSFPSTAIELRENEPIAVVDDDGEALPELHEIMDIVRAHDAVLNMGHLGASDIHAVLDAAEEHGIDRLVVSHPTFIVNASDDDLIDWARRGVRVEHCLSLLTSRRVVRMTVDGLVAAIRLTGVESVMLSSDLGQAGNPLPITAYRWVLRALLDNGFVDSEVEHMLSVPQRELLYP